MSSGGDEVEECVNAVVPEPGVTLDPRFLSENVIVLALKVADNFLEPGIIKEKVRPVRPGRIRRVDARVLIVDVVTKARSIDDSQCNADTVLFEF